MNYSEYSRLKEEEYESLCTRCGACCGVYDDPCVYLEKTDNDRYHCKIYKQRLGIRKTVRGQVFNCVPIREILSTHWPKDYQCPYKRIYRG